MAIAATERTAMAGVWRWVVVAGLVPISAFVVVFATLLDQVAVAGTADLRSVSSGWPIAW
jgi:hypothetical protein